MTKKIRNTGPTYPVIRNTGATLPRLDPAQVAAALGGEPANVCVEGNASPLTQVAIAAELPKLLASANDPSKPADATDSQKFALSDEQWKQLEELATSLAAGGVVPSAGQVAGALLSLSLRTLAGASGDRTMLVQELAKNAPCGEDSAQTNR